MVKCIHTKCQYPKCDRTCGLGSNSIIKMLQEQIEELLVERALLRGKLYNIYNESRQIHEYLNPENNFNEACAKVCAHGYTDCIHNPEYLRRYHPEYWVELGMPTECKNDEYCYYDDEDK